MLCVCQVFKASFRPNVSKHIIKSMKGSLFRFTAIESDLLIVRVCVCICVCVVRSVGGLAIINPER